VSQFIPVLKTSEILEGAMKKVKAGGKDIMIARTGANIMPSITAVRTPAATCRRENSKGRW
jgi:hypothetical protein